jgi:hypothetical protein
MKGTLNMCTSNTFLFGGTLVSVGILQNAVAGPFWDFVSPTTDMTFSAHGIWDNVNHAYWYGEEFNDGYSLDVVPPYKGENHFGIGSFAATKTN